MEAYDALLRDFHHSRTGLPQIADYKALKDELTNSKVKRRKKLEALRRQHAASKQDCRSSIRSSRVSRFSGHESILRESSLQSSRVSGCRMDNQHIERRELQKQISELRNEMVAIRQKKQKVVESLKILQSKNCDSSTLQHQCTTDLLHSREMLSITAQRCNTEEAKQLSTTIKLRNRRQQLQEEITVMTDRQKHVDELKSRWKKAKFHKFTTVKWRGMPLKELQTILRSCFLLLRLDFCNKLSNQFVKNQEEKLLESSRQILSLGSTAKIIDYYVSKKVFFDPRMVHKIVELYKGLQLQFDRQERAQSQVLLELQALKEKEQTLNEEVAKLERSKWESTQQALEKAENKFRKIESHFLTNTKLIHHISSKLHQLSVRMGKIRATANHCMVCSAQGSRWALDDEESSETAQFTTLLLRSPEEITLNWSEEGQTFFKQFVAINPLLRFHCSCKGYSDNLDQLENWQLTSDHALRKAAAFVSEFKKELVKHFKLTKVPTQKSSSSNRRPTQLSETQQKPLEDIRCMESKEYYRRDNYKLLQKLERDSLRKRGLLVQLPLNMRGDDELNESSPRKPSLNKTSSGTKIMIKKGGLRYTRLASKRQQQSIDSHQLRMMVSRMNTLGSRSSSRLRDTLSSCMKSSTNIQGRLTTGVRVTRRSQPRTTLDPRSTNTSFNVQPCS